MDFTLFGKFTKIDRERRLVTGVATADNIDKEDDKTNFRGSIEAFEEWPGNVREMHAPIAVGNLVNFNTVKVEDKGRVYDGLETTVYVSKGAQNTWEKVLDGTLKGFSIGGDIVEAVMEYDSKVDKSFRHIKKYRLHELSLVDNPANQAALISSIIKMEGDNLVYKAADSIEDVHELFYCEKDGLAKVDDETCSCGHKMEQIGFIEDFNNEEIKKMINIHTNGGEEEHSVLHKNDNTDSINTMDDTLDSAQKEKVLDRLSKFIFGDDSGDSDDQESEGIAGLFSPVFNINVGGDNENPVVEETTSTEVEDSTEDEVEAADEAGKADDESADTDGDASVNSTNEEDDEVNAEDVIGKLAEVLDEKLGEFEKTVDGKIEEIAKSVDTKMEEVTETVEKQAGELEKFASEGAVSKSADIADEDDDDTIAKSDDTNDEAVESFWGGTFVPTEISKALGYES